MKQLRFSRSDSPTTIQAWLKQLQAHAPYKGAMRYIWSKENQTYCRFAHFYDRLQRLSRHYRRALQRILGVSLSTAAFLLAIGLALPAKANTIIVDGTTCTLADAITAANTDSAINGCLAGAGNDIIDLQTDLTLTAELPYITSTLTLNGNSHTLDGAESFRVLQIGNLDPDLRAHHAIIPNVTIENINIVNGYPVDASFFQEGGGINVDQGHLTLINSTLSGHKSDTGGGAISIYNGSADIVDSTIENSTATQGAGIYAGYSDLTISNSVISGNIATEYGGGVQAYYGSVVISNTQIMNNHASAGAGIALYGFNAHHEKHITHSTVSGNEATNLAGGISAVYSGVTIHNSTITNNSAKFSGGVDLYGKPSADSPLYTIVISQSTIANNHATGSGGGLNIYYSDAHIHQSTLSGNKAIDPDADPNVSAYTVGGAINAYNSTLTVTESTLSGNSSNGSGGGIYFYGDQDHSLMVAQSTLSGNEARERGAGIIALTYGSQISVSQSTITQNRTETADAERGAGININESNLTLKNTIISGNTAGELPSEVYTYTNAYAAPPETQHNLFGLEGETAVYGFTPDETDITPTGNISTVLDTTLANNGGETLTHMLAATSPAIDQGIQGKNTPSYDQRGWRRIIGDGLDIGSVEAPIKQFLSFIARSE